MLIEIKLTEINLKNGAVFKCVCFKLLKGQIGFHIKMLIDCYLF